MNHLLWQFVTRWTAVAATAATLALGAATAQAQSRLLEPDFSGMFLAGNLGTRLMLRDSARGWTYFSGGPTVDGVVMSAFLFRISDAGLPDTRWALPADFQVTDAVIAADGTPFAEAYVKDSPTFEKRWYRLHKDSVGSIKPAALANTDELPPIDSTRVDSAALPLRLIDGSRIKLDIVSMDAPPYTTTYVLRKRNNQGALLWERLIGGVPHNLNVDPQGRCYVTGEALVIAGKTGNLLRVLADGSVDSGWSPAIEITQNVESRVRVLGNRIILADTVNGNLPVNRVGSYDLISGAKLSERFPIGFGLGSAIADDGVLPAMGRDGRPTLLNTTRNDSSADRSIDARLGSGGFVASVAQWRGGYVVGGRFDYWFDGKLYRNLMRLNAAFRPDPNWTPAVDGTVTALAVDRAGVLIAGGGFTLGAMANLVRFDSSGAVDAAWSPSVVGKIYKIVPASDGLLFVSGAFSSINGLNRGSIARFLANGSLDADWASQPAWPVLSPEPGGGFGRDGIYNLVDAGTDGIIFVWEDGFMNGADAGTVRLSRDGVGTVLPLPKALYSNIVREDATGSLYALVDNALIPPIGANRGLSLARLSAPGLTIDQQSSVLTGVRVPDIGGLARVTENYAYLCDFVILRRFNKTTGAMDLSWNKNSMYPCTDNHISLPTTLLTGELSLTWANIYGSAPSRYTSNTLINEPRTVVEYYSRAAKRFFITARANEQAELNARPDAFVATGMQFAAEAANVLSTDQTRVPVCRFYAPPEAGGSNTHFYGSANDCVLLKRFATLRYEGLDFRAGRPSEGACPASLPQKVYRLFNNASASNNGNHRYVVSETRRSEMLAVGWDDEGIAFCTENSQDSQPLTQLTQ
jgi:hypothetical protein